MDWGDTGQVNYINNQLLWVTQSKGFDLFKQKRDLEEELEGNVHVGSLVNAA